MKLSSRTKDVGDERVGCCKAVVSDCVVRAREGGWSVSRFPMRTPGPGLSSASVFGGTGFHSNLAIL